MQFMKMYSITPENMSWFKSFKCMLALVSNLKLIQYTGVGVCVGVCVFT